MKKLCMAFMLSYGTLYANTNLIYQYSTPDYLLRGQYGPVVSVKDAKQDGINFGIGAGVGLGELIINNGNYYLTDPYGKLSKLKATDNVSYLTGVNFKPEKTYTFKNITSLNMLQDLIESQAVSSPHSFYAIRILSKNANITARSENKDSEPYTPINIWIKNNQNVFSLKNRAVTLIMLRTPDDLSQLNLKYHTHFITNDETYGGHLFDFSSAEVVVQIEQLDNITIHLPSKSYAVVKDAKAGTMQDFVHVVESN
jgi:acetolactate decarboxylase